MTRNDSVVTAFALGRPARAGRLRTDGRSLWSYSTKIAERTLAGIVVGNFTSPGGHFVSQTTSCHVNLAKRVADTIMLPEQFDAIFSKMPF
jgi:hypothetical protein